MTQKPTHLYEVAFLLLLASVFALASHYMLVPSQHTVTSVAAKDDVVPSITTNLIHQITTTPTLPLVAATVLPNAEAIYPVESRYPAPHYSTLPLPTNDGDWGSYKLLIVMAASYTHTDPEDLAMMAARESQFTASVQNGHSRATGLFQFVPGTWKAMVRRYGGQYGITLKTPITDPRANALMGAEYLKENEAYLATQLKRSIQPTEIYMAHLLGAGGALSIIKARSTALAINIRPDAVSGNRSLFYTTVNGISKPVTVYEFRKRLRNHTARLHSLYGESAIAYSDLLSGHRQGSPMALNYVESLPPTA